MHDASSVTALTRDARTVVRLTGEIDASMRDPADTALSTALQASRPVMVDMQDVTFMDSTGVAFLIQCDRACTEADLPFRLERVPEPALQVLDVRAWSGCSPVQHPGTRHAFRASGATRPLRPPGPGTTSPWAGTTSTW